MFHKDEALKLAEKIHGHLSPGIALGIRMVEIAYKHLGTKKRGKGIVGIAETSICLPDALQAYAGTTPGNQNLIVLDYGKLAISLVKFEDKIGYRISLKKEAAKICKELDKFIYRKEKLTKTEREKLVEIFLNLDEKYFNVERIKLTIPVGVKKEKIVQCDSCKELQPVNYMKKVNNKYICNMCLNGRYYEKI